MGWYISWLVSMSLIPFSRVTLLVIKIVSWICQRGLPFSTDTAFVLTWKILSFIWSSEHIFTECILSQLNFLVLSYIWWQIRSIGISTPIDYWWLVIIFLIIDVKRYFILGIWLIIKVIISRDTLQVSWLRIVLSHQEITSRTWSRTQRLL